MSSSVRVGAQPSTSRARLLFATRQGRRRAGAKRPQQGVAQVEEKTMTSIPPRRAASIRVIAPATLFS